MRRPAGEAVSFPQVDAMPLLYRHLFQLMWSGWILFWFMASLNVKASARRESFLSHASYLVLLVAAALLAWMQNMPIPILYVRFLPRADWPLQAGAVLTAAGLLLSIWARIHIGRNWSGTVTIKHGHELVQTGPYALVRHPIYSGLLLAIAGFVVARAEWRDLLALGVATLAFWRKLTIEERWMVRQFGGAYEAYRMRVAALVPFVL